MEKRKGRLKSKESDQFDMLRLAHVVILVSCLCQKSLLRMILETVDIRLEFLLDGILH